MVVRYCLVAYTADAEALPRFHVAWGMRDADIITDTTCLSRLRDSPIPRIPYHDYVPLYPERDCITEPRVA